MSGLVLVSRQQYHHTHAEPSPWNSQWSAGTWNLRLTDVTESGRFLQVHSAISPYLYIPKRHRMKNLNKNRHLADQSDDAKHFASFCHQQDLGFKPDSCLGNVNLMSKLSIPEDFLSKLGHLAGSMVVVLAPRLVADVNNPMQPWQPWVRVLIDRLLLTTDIGGLRRISEDGQVELTNGRTL